jgi:hypothetical protein
MQRAAGTEIRSPWIKPECKSGAQKLTHMGSDHTCPSGAKSMLIFPRLLGIRKHDAWTNPQRQRGYSSASADLLFDGAEDFDNQNARCCHLWMSILYS